MIHPEELKNFILAAFPDAEIEIADRTGAMDHYRIRVASGSFAGVTLMDRHRMVMGVLQPLMADGRLHAAEIKTEVPTEAS